MILILYQLFYKTSVKEGLLASTVSAENYSPDDAFQDINNHDSRLTALETQVKNNNDEIIDLQSKASHIEGYLPSQQAPYTQQDEDTDINNQKQRIIALQTTVKKHIIDISDLNTKLKLIPRQAYPAGTDAQLSIEPSTNNRDTIIAHEKAITNLEQVVKNNTSDISEINRQIQETINKHKGPVDKLTAAGPPKIAGL